MKNSTKLSRRTLVQKASLAAAAGMLGFASSDSTRSQNARPAANGQKPRALALIGDRFHNSDYIRVALDKTFKELNIPIDYTIQYDQISANLLKDYQLFLCLARRNDLAERIPWPRCLVGVFERTSRMRRDSRRPKPAMWMTEEQGAAIKDFVNAGNGLYALHNSSHISLTSKNYREVMGGAYIGHPPLRPFRVSATANKHPITEGITPFMVNDEQHYVIYDKDPKYVLLEAENIDGLTFETLGAKSISGWAYDFGKGTRCVYRRGPHHPCDVGAAISGNPKTIGAMAIEADIRAESQINPAVSDRVPEIDRGDEE